jgi:uncharacterized protein YggE
MDRRILGGLSILLAASGPAAAQAPGDRMPTDPGPPSLHLLATETSKIALDELVATMSAMATGARALTAQQQVNALVAKTKAVTDKTKSVRTAFQGYTVNFIDEKPPHWIAQQAVEVRGVNGDDVLNMVGQLQGEGLSITSLGWQVSQDRAQKAQRAATIEALHKLREEANDAASALGVEVDRFQHVDLSEEPRVVPFMRGGMQMAAKVAMPTPVSTPEEQAITATVTADVLLRTPKAKRSLTP